MLNKVILMGRFTAEPELKSTSNGTSVTTFTLAVDRDYSKEDKQTDFITCVAWRNTAEFISKYFSKGQLVAVDGSIQTRSYTDKDGNKRTAFEVVVNQAYFAEKKATTAPVTETNPTAATVTKPLDMDGFEEILSDDGAPF